MAIKLIAIDMDGTLLLPDHTISPAVKNAIAAAREKGVNVVLTTGPSVCGCAQLSEKNFTWNSPVIIASPINGGAGAESRGRQYGCANGAQL